MTVLMPQEPDGKDHCIPANADESELWQQARGLQRVLDGYIGTSGDIDGYYRVLQRFAD